VCHPFALAIITGLSTIEIRHLHFSLSPITVRIFGSPVAFLSVRFWRLVHIGSIQFRLVLLLPLHPPVLEPYFDLSLCQTESVGYLDSPPASEIPIEVEFLLQLEGLVARVRLSPSLPLKLAPHPGVEGRRQGRLGCRLLGWCSAVCVSLRRRVALAPHVSGVRSLRSSP